MRGLHGIDQVIQSTFGIIIRQRRRADSTESSCLVVGLRRQASTDDGFPVPSTGCPRVVQDDPRSMTCCSLAELRSSSMRSSGSASRHEPHVEQPSEPSTSGSCNSTNRASRSGCSRSTCSTRDRAVTKSRSLLRCHDEPGAEGIEDFNRKTSGSVRFRHLIEHLRDHQAGGRRFIDRDNSLLLGSAPGSPARTGQAANRSGTRSGCRKRIHMVGPIIGYRHTGRDLEDDPMSSPSQSSSMIRAFIAMASRAVQPFWGLFP